MIKLRQPESEYIYKRLRLDYTYGLNGIYSNEDIAQARKRPSWEHEYCLKFLGLIGNVFHHSQVDEAMVCGKEYKDIPMNLYVSHSLGIDPRFSTSRTALVLVPYLEEFNKRRVIFSEELEGHPSRF